MESQPFGSYMTHRIVTKLRLKQGTTRLVVGNDKAVLVFLIIYWKDPLIFSQLFLEWVWSFILTFTEGCYKLILNELRAVILVIESKMLNVHLRQTDNCQIRKAC